MNQYCMININLLRNKLQLRYKGVKPLIHQSELRTYTKVVPFQEKKFLSFCSIVKTTECNGLIKIDN